MSTQQYDVIIVGAGAAGIGMGATLRDLGVENFTLVDRHEIGASFLRWPRQMRFISPSFTGNAFGLLDLNAVTFTTSPAYSLGSEHPTGAEYARYLQGVAELYQLPVQAGVDVQKVVAAPVGAAEGFRLQTSAGEMRSRFVVWAAGEFQYPNSSIFAGSEACLHNAAVNDWAELAGDEFVIIGGYESGMDAAINLVALGKRVRVLDDTAPWTLHAPDPSLVLSPYTQQRLRGALATERLELLEWEVSAVEKTDGGYTIRSAAGETLQTGQQPILATGFNSSLVQLGDLLEWHPQRHHALLTLEDESTRAPGLFLSGPFVRHDAVILCFIYKFRQRFAVIANAIGQRMGLDTSVLETYRQHGMYLDDLSCCEENCAAC